MSNSQAIDEFIEGLGLSLQQDGLPRIAGRMLGLFIVDKGPYSLAELAARLQVSRASVCTNARILRQLGYIERMAKPGDRQDYYILSEDPYQQLLKGYVGRIQERVLLIEKLEGSFQHKDPEAGRRLKRMRYFYNAALEATRKLLQGLTESDESRHD